MSDTRYMTIARRFVEDIFNSREIELAKDYVSPDIIFHGMGEEVTGLENFKRWVAGDFSAFPDMKRCEVSRNSS